jgi:hypothetical protein
MANERLRKTVQAYAAEAHLQAAANAAPPNSVKRILKRFPSEHIQEAIARAQLMPWWMSVINPLPRGDIRYWVWFCTTETLEDSP